MRTLVAVGLAFLLGLAIGTLGTSSLRQSDLEFYRATWFGLGWHCRNLFPEIASDQECLARYRQPGRPHA